MQLKPKTLRPALATAAATLLGPAQAAPLGGEVVQEELNDASAPSLPPVPLRRYPAFLEGAQARVASLLYKEDDGRILVWENVLQAAHAWDDDRRLTITGTTDLITGASPVGTVPSQSTQIITGASGQTTTVTAGALPLYPVSDVRLAIAAAYAYPLGPGLAARSAVNAAEERDYTAIGIAQRLNRSWGHEITTLSLDFALTRETLEPIGGIPPALAREGSFTLAGGEDGENRSRLTLEWQLGLSQVLSRRLLLQGQYFGGHLNGYLTDPYKRISYVSGISGEPLPGQGTWTERRPDRRTYHGLALGLLAALPGGLVWRNEGRMFRDDWSIRATSLDTRLDLPQAFDRGFSLYARYYRQSAAWFYHYRLADGPGPGIDPADITADPSRLSAASADWRLGALEDLTLGVGYRHTLPSGPWLDGDWRLRLGRFVQWDQAGRFPTLRAWSAFFSLRLDW